MARLVEVRMADHDGDLRLLVTDAMRQRTRGALLTSDAVALAEAVLAALAEAGRLLPADAREEWAAGTRYVIRPATPDRREAEAQLRSYGTKPGSQLLRRWVGPWLPVDPEPAGEKP